MVNFFLENKITTITNYDEPWEPQARKIKDSDFNRTAKLEKKLT